MNLDMRPYKLIKLKQSEKKIFKHMNKPLVLYMNNIKQSNTYVIAVIEKRKNVTKNLRKQWPNISQI